jgi:hypothetical protein
MTQDPSPTARIRALNDQLRTNVFSQPGHIEGQFRVMLTQGCQALTLPELDQLTRQIETFTAFTEDNDPHGEHDFGAVTVGETQFFFKIDYYDPALSAHSPDAADPQQTIRVLTIMRADEY